MNTLYDTIINQSFKPSIKLLYKDYKSYFSTDELEYFSSIYKKYPKKITHYNQIEFSGLLTTASNIFEDNKLHINIYETDYNIIENYIIHFNNLLSKKYLNNNFEKDRINKIQRISKGLELSKRQYNKNFRLLKRLELKLQKYKYENERTNYTKIKIYNQLFHISQLEFEKDTLSSLFISILAIHKHFDIIENFEHHLAFQSIKYKLISNKNTNWLAISLVYPEKFVLKKLTSYEKGKLLGIWFKSLLNLAIILKKIWHKSNINKNNMVSIKGIDTYNWNFFTDIWNHIRVIWIKLNFCLGSYKIIENIPINKILRLKSHNKISKNKIQGGTLDLDNKIWCELPLPWDIISNNKKCNIQHVKNICEKFGVDPLKRNWLTPKPYKQNLKFNIDQDFICGIKDSSIDLYKSLEFNNLI